MSLALFAHAPKQGEQASTGSRCFLRGCAGRFPPEHYITMWRDRLGLAAGPSRPVAAVQAPAPAGRSLTERSLDSLRQQRDAEDERAARTQTELDNTLAQISVANQGGARKVPPPPLPPPAPPPAPPPVSDSPIGGARADSRGSGGAGAAGGQQAAPAPQGGQDDLLAAIRGGVAQRAEQRSTPLPPCCSPASMSTAPCVMP